MCEHFEQRWELSKPDFFRYENGAKKIAYWLVIILPNICSEAVDIIQNLWNYVNDI